VGTKEGMKIGYARVSTIEQNLTSLELIVLGWFPRPSGIPGV
jgi:hypothetical protein